MNKERRLLEYIDASIAEIESYVAASSQHPLDIEGSPRYAALWFLEHLADATTQLSDDLKTRHPEIPWRAIRDLCNVYAHGYLDLKLGFAKRTITEDLPILRRAVAEELSWGEIS